MAGCETIKTLFKGAGPGTHWHQNDARVQGLVGSARSSTVNAIVNHITAYSHPSPYLSVTSSFAIARRYALLGPLGLAAPSAPGCVYEIDLSAISNPVKLIDPIKHIASHFRGAGAHEHNGDQVLLSEIAMGNHGAKPYAQAHQLGGRLAMPAVNAQLTALVFAIRDAELLVFGAVPHHAVVQRHDVW